MSDRPAPQRPAPRSYLKGEERRAEILDRAIEVIAEQGAGASLRAIAESLGVSHAALRYYFSSRDELLVEVYREHEARNDAAAAERDAGREPAGPAPVASMESGAERNRAIPGLVELYATLTTDALRGELHPHAQEFITARFRNIRARIAEEVRAAQALGAVAEDIDPVAAAALVIAASDGLQLQWLLDPEEVDMRRGLNLLERILPSTSSTP
ncbi:TetR/AcrR family transcriptional regulator [Brachybacterium sp. DNPG3]